MSAYPENGATTTSEAASNVTPLRRVAERVIAGVTEATPLGPATQDPNAALENLQIPRDLLDNLFRHVSEPGLEVDSAKVEDRYNGEIIRAVTAVRCKERTVYLAQIPGFVLDNPTPANLAAVDYLGTMFPPGTVISILSPDLPSGSHRSFERIWEAWERSKEITVHFVPSRHVDDLKKRDFSASEVIDVLHLREILAPSAIQTAPSARKPETTFRVFYSYAREDDELREQLVEHLSSLKRARLIAPWNDRNITAGADWESDIDENLEAADIILLLISSHFLASEYIDSNELKRALERHASDEARVVPVILRPVDWEGAPFASLQAVPKDGKAVTTWDNVDEAWADVAKSLRKLITELRASASP